MVGQYNAKSLIMETFGTFMLCYIGGLAVMLDHNLFNIALAHAIILFVLIHMGGDISGGYFNPAVTIGFVVTKDNDLKITLSYLIVQILGSLLAGFLLLLKHFKAY